MRVTNIRLAVSVDVTGVSLEIPFSASVIRPEVGCESLHPRRKPQIPDPAILLGGHHPMPAVRHYNTASVFGRGNLTSYRTAYDERTVAATPRCFMAFYFPPISASRNL